MHTFTCVCESQRCFFSPLSLKYIISFFLSALSVPVRSCLLCVPWLPCVSCCAPVACPVLSSVCVPLKLPCGLLCVLPCVFRLLPSLVCYQAQDAMTVWANAPRIIPRPFVLLLPMCCRGLSRCPFRCLFRCLSCLLSSVRVCVLLPAVVWWQ